MRANALMRTVALLCALSLPILSACTETAEDGSAAVEGSPDASGETTPQAEETAVVTGDPQAAFWEAVQGLCGQAFEGQIAESIPPDNSFRGQRLVMHVRECSDDEIRIPFFVGDDRSRTWVLTPTPDGLRLKHDHRHEDGSEEDLTQYGGDTSGPGTATSQDFPADAHTAEIVPAAANNIWTLEVHPGASFAYALRRVGADRRFRAEFDLTNPIEEPPPPWGS